MECIIAYSGFLGLMATQRDLHFYPLTHIFMHSFYMQRFSFTHHLHSDLTAVRSDVGFSVLPEGTSGLEKPGIELPTNLLLSGRLALTSEEQPPFNTMTHLKDVKGKKMTLFGSCLLPDYD